MASNKAFNNITSDMTYAQIIERILSIALNAGYTISNPVTVVLDVDNRAHYGAYTPATNISVTVSSTKPTAPIAVGTFWLDTGSGSTTFRTILVNAVAPPGTPVYYSISDPSGILNPNLGIRTVIGRSKDDADAGNITGGGTGVSAHSDLTGLTTGDDHTQYLNTTRGDARYAALGSDAWLKSFATDPSEIFTGTRTLDANGVVTSSPVTWPNGASGVFTATTVNATFKCVDAYTVTYVDGTTKTVTQPAVTRNGTGEITIRPALTIS
jgi:hypothetical protein